MESLGEMVIQEGGEFVAIGNRARLVGEILEDEARIVGGAKEGAIDALCPTLDEGTRSPNESNAEEGAECHAKLGVTCEDTGKEAGKEEAGQERAEEEEDAIAALDEDVAGAAAEESGNLEHAMFDDGVGEGKRIEEYEQGK